MGHGNGPRYSAWPLGISELARGPVLLRRARAARPMALRSALCVRPSILGAALTHSAQRSAQCKQSIAAAPSRLRLRRAQEQRQGPGIRGSEQAAKSPNSVVRHIPSTSASASASGDRARRARRDHTRHLLAAGMWGIGIACSSSRRVSRNTTRLVRGMRRVCRAVQSSYHSSAMARAMSDGQRSISEPDGGSGHPLAGRYGLG